MNATVKITINPRDAVPTEGRVAWLDRHGVLPESAEISVTAPLATWARVAGVEADGTVRCHRYDSLYGQLSRTALAIVSATGSVPEELGAGALELIAVKREAEEASRVAAQRARDAEAAARNASAVEAIRAAGLEAIVRRTKSGWVSTYEDDSSERVANVRAALGPDAYERADAEAVERNKREAAELASKRAPYLAAIAALATTIPDLARASEEGYSVERAVLDRITETLRAEVPAQDSSVDTRTWDDLEDRAAPSPAAFELHDAARAAIHTANASLPTAIGQWVLSRIVRLDACLHADEHHWVTAVVATLRTPTGAIREITWSTESLACEHDTRDED